MRSAILGIRVMFLILDNIGMRVYYASLNGPRKKCSISSQLFNEKWCLNYLAPSSVEWPISHERGPKKTKQQKKQKETASCKLLSQEQRHTGRGVAGGGGCGGSAPNFSKIWNFPGKKLMTRKTVVEVKNSNNNKNNDNNNNTNDCHSQTSGYMDTSQIQACSVNRWRELVDYAPIPLNRRGGGGGVGVAEGRVCGGDLTFFKNFAVKFLPTGKSFQSIATKFPHHGCTLLSNMPRLNPRNAQ